ncbi:hypothetical protein CKA49_36370 [Pseudomonas aeruginosa]|nr:hypothetical protein CKA49_36370 [Pseudomonas aeruginosa]
MLKLDLKTPGREDDDEETRLYSKNDYQQKTTQPTNAATEQTINALGEEIIEGLGGRKNIETVDNCYTRLRVIVKNVDEIHEDKLKKTGAKGVVRHGNNVQVVYGLHVKKMREAVEAAL